MRRTLLTAGVFALAALMYVPRQHYGYSFIYSPGDTSIAFFQLLVNVVFAALLGAILATIVSNISRRALYTIAGCIAGAALGVALIAFCQAAAARAQHDEDYAETLAVWPRALPAMLGYLRNAARNWRLALRFDEATRVENRIMALQKHAAQDWQSDPVVDLFGLPDQTSGQRTPAPSASRRAEHGPWEDYAAQGPTPIPKARPVRSPPR